MEFSGVYHKTSEQMSYALDEDRLIVNIKTGYDVKQVFIHYGDPYEAGILGGKEKWIGKREEMIYKKRLPYQIWWTTTLLPEYKRCLKASLSEFKGQILLFCFQCLELV